MKVLVWDASALHHAIVADRLDVLGDLAQGTADCPWHNVTTATVSAELRRNGLTYGSAWLDTVHVDGPEDLRLLIPWIEQFKAGKRDLGEATVCAWAQNHAAIAVIDDGRARRTAEDNGLIVHGSLWVIADGVRSGRTTMTSANGLVNELITAGARYPFPANGFEAWAKRHRLHLV